MASWVEYNIATILNIDPVQFDAYQKKIVPQFDAFGYQQYQAYLKSSGILELLRNNHLRQNAIADSGSTLLSQGALAGTYHWLYQMPMMLTEVANRGASLNDYVRWSAENPAKVWGLYPQKGTLMIGSDADIAIVDVAREWIVDDAQTQSIAKISPWQGRKVKGLPIHTLVRGRFVMRDRVLQDTKGWGRSVHDIQRMPPAEPRNVAATMSAILKGTDHG